MMLYLDKKEFNPYYGAYIKVATSENIIEGLKINLQSISTFFESISPDKLDYAYAEGKWTIKDILLHLIDTERIFAYRALRIARSDTTSLPGFDQDKYVVTANAKNRTVESLIPEYRAVRLASISLFETFNSEDLLQMGQASNSNISVRAIGYIISGHENHHKVVIEQRYL